MASGAIKSMLELPRLPLYESIIGLLIGRPCRNMAYHERESKTPGGISQHLLGKNIPHNLERKKKKEKVGVINKIVSEKEGRAMLETTARKRQYCVIGLVTCNARKTAEEQNRHFTGFLRKEPKSTRWKDTVCRNIEPMDAAWNNGVNVCLTLKAMDRVDCPICIS